MQMEESGASLEKMIEDLKNDLDFVGDRSEDGVEYKKVTEEEVVFDLSQAQESLINVVAFAEGKVLELDSVVKEIVDELTNGQGAWKDRLELAKTRRKTESIMPVVNYLTSLRESSDFSSSSSASSDTVELAEKAFERYCKSLKF